MQGSNGPVVNLIDVIGFFTVVVAIIITITNYFSNGRKIRELETGYEKKIKELDKNKASSAWVNKIEKAMMENYVEDKVCNKCQEKNDEKHDTLEGAIRDLKKEVCNGFKEVKDLITNNKV